MRWRRRGAGRLLQVRCALYNGTLGTGFTYAGHPVAAAVALETLKIYETDGIVAHVQEVAPRFQSRLRALGRHPLVGEARGIGLIGGLEIVRNTAKGDPIVYGLERLLPHTADAE